MVSCKRFHPLLAIASLFLTAVLATSAEETTALSSHQDHRPIHLITLDPGHFHAALVQKTMYESVSPVVHVYAPDGPELSDHLQRIESFNRRATNPTHWEEKVITGPDYLERMLREKPGNVVVISGNNRRKAEYIKACIDAGLNVLADKPMCIDAKGLALLEQAFASAAERNLLLYDIMTERYEITSILQRELVQDEALFGTLLPGNPSDPSVVKESVHHFFKYVAGSPIQRPPWFFDTLQQGEGIADVTTHLVDLVMWTCFPEEAIDFERDIELLKSRRWPTRLTREQFSQATRRDDFPDSLRSHLDSAGALLCFANGEMVCTIRGIHARVAVRWNFVAPEGAGDTHRSVMKGSKATLSILQGPEQKYRPELFIEPAPGVDTEKWAAALHAAITRLRAKYSGMALAPRTDATKGAATGGWHVVIPDEYRVSHEAHFEQVTRKYIAGLAAGELPAWEAPNMLAKYHTTVGALELALATAEAATDPSPPPGAIRLFDGTVFAHWTHVNGEKVRWRIVEGAMEVLPGSGSIVTSNTFEDFRLHIEFNVPRSAEDITGQGRGNSGVYLQRRYEVQILDSYGLEPEKDGCGALYGFRAPDTNACHPPGDWQSYDIVFHSPRFQTVGGEATKTHPARITVWQNGILIHDEVTVSRKTGRGEVEGPTPGPILLQDHGSNVRFRNIWIVPLEPPR
ncbi:MAG: putative oxidoreductase C-terminal domain-containing protein [Planctomycetota bacterium]